MSSYNPNIPQLADLILKSQPQIFANFQAINSTWANNHTSLTGTDPQGMHTALTLRPQAGDPTTTSKQTAIYNKLVSSAPQLFFRPSTNGTPIQMTYPSLDTTTAGSQYSFVAGPFIIHAGSRTNINNSTPPIVLTPGSSLIYVGLTTFNHNNIFVGMSTPININTPANSFTPKFAGALSVFNNSIYYIAVGLP